MCVGCLNEHGPSKRPPSFLEISLTLVSFCWWIGGHTGAVVLYELAPHRCRFSVNLRRGKHKKTHSVLTDSPVLLWSRLRAISCVIMIARQEEEEELVYELN